MRLEVEAPTSNAVAGSGAVPADASANVPADAPRDAERLQPVLGRRGLYVFLALLSAFPPLSTDLYLPSLPTMTSYFGVAESLTNLTLLVFFVFFALSTLVWGPLSDRFGRRPVMLVGLTLYAVASLACAVAADVYQLILFRALQAIGGGAGAATGTAIVKDVFEGRRRETALAIVQALFFIAPAAAPAIGSGLLAVTSWRGVFVTQALIGAVVVAGAFVFEETIEVRQTGGLGHALGRLIAVAANPRFSSLLVIFSLTSVASLSFVGASSYIYQNEFGLSSGAFSLFFAFNAAGLLIGPMLFVFVGQRFPRFAVISASLLVMGLSGAAVATFGVLGPFAFAPLLLPATIAMSCGRPPAAHLLLTQAESDAGSASALMGATGMIMGSVGVAAVSVIPGSMARTVGVLNFAIGFACLAAWTALSRRPYLVAQRGTE